MTEHRDPGAAPDYIKDLNKHLPANWEDPRVRVVSMLMEQSGLLPSIIRRNPDLSTRLTSFFAGNKDVLVVGGESGMGKSLIAAELQRLHGDLQHVLPPHLHQPLAIFGWDRLHQQFFDQVSLEAGATIPLPKGETHPDGRELISQELRSLVRFTKTHYRNHPKILIETPLIDTRGELVLNGLPEFKNQIQVLIMHSPETRRETLFEGRLKNTSNQVLGMEDMREKLARKILGDLYKTIPKDQLDSVIKLWWEQQLTHWDGTVVEWDPNDDRRGYTDSKKLFTDSQVQSDQVLPRKIGAVVRRDFESIFETIVDMDAFLKKVAA